MHREIRRATGITEDERTEYEAKRPRRLMNCKKGKRCSNLVLCPTCAWVRQKKGEDFIDAAYDALGTPGYMWQEIVVSVLYDVKDAAEYAVAALRERIGIAQEVRRGLWDELLDHPGSGATYTIERGHGRGRKHGGHVHLNLVYFGPALSKDSVTRAARAAHLRAGKVCLKAIDHDPGGAKCDDPRGSKAGVKRVTMYVSKGGATTHYDEKVRIADDRALTMDARFDIASRGTQLGQRLGACRGLGARRRRSTAPSRARPVAPETPAVLHTEATDIAMTDPRVQVATLSDRWLWDGSVWQEFEVPLRDGDAPSTPYKVVQAAVARAALGPHGRFGSMNVAFGHIASHFQAGFPDHVGDPDAVRLALLKMVGRATRTWIVAIDDDDRFWWSHPHALMLHSDEGVLDRAGDRPSLMTPNTTAWRPTTATFAIEDGLVSGSRHTWRAYRAAARGEPLEEVRYTEATEFEFVLAMVEHLAPARLGTSDHERIVEGLVLDYLAEDIERHPHGLSTEGARALLLPAVERVTGWSVVALDGDDQHWVYGAHTVERYECEQPC